MFSLLKKVGSLVWDWKSSGSEAIEPDTSLSHHEKSQTGYEQRLSFNGKVTKINYTESYGLIDDLIYFSFDVICGSEKLSIGYPVFGAATRANPGCCWSALSVSPHEEQWDFGKPVKSETADQEGQSLKKEPFIEGVITELMDEYGILDNALKFSLKTSKEKFCPMVNDWIIITFDKEENGNVISLQPKETKFFQGVVTSHNGNNGIINNEVVFYLSSCQCDSPVYLGEEVLVNAIKSEQKQYKWRATEIRKIDCSDVSNQAKPLLIKKEDLFITSPLDFGDVMLFQKKTIEVKILNMGLQPIIFLKCRFLNLASDLKIQLESSSMIDDVTSSPMIRLLPKAPSLLVTIHCKPEIIGAREESLIFEFEEFSVIRTLKMNVINPVQSILKPKLCFGCINEVKARPFRNDSLVIVPGEKPFRKTGRFSKDLPTYAIPQYLWKTVEEKKKIVNVVKCLAEELSPNNYIQKFKTLLHLEEIQMSIDMRDFDISQVCLKNRGDFLILEVPGLAEGRPSVLIGDRVMLYHPSDNVELAYEGFVHEVFQNEVHLKFNDSFQNRYQGESFNVTFQFNRTGLRRCHHSIHYVKQRNIKAIFPDVLKLKHPLVQRSQNLKGENSRLHSYQCNNVSPEMLSVEDINWINEDLNQMQKGAVCRILEGQCRPFPYIVFGPPGTGKTACLVEAVLQISLTFEASKIIICTPSNSAADLVVQRLLESHTLGKNDIVRLNSYQRNVENIPEFIKPFCKDKCDLEAVVEFPVIVSTLSTVGSIYTLGLPTNHFSHVFIDEAGQSMEPECLIGIGLVTPNDGQVILFGDPQQLGPVVHSRPAKAFGLQMSYLERIMRNKLYERDKRMCDKYSGFNHLLITMLIESYRCHPAIIDFSSKEFYFSELISNPDVVNKGNLETLGFLPKKGFPVVFHGIIGEEFREENSPSWFNSAEVVQVIHYLQMLFEEGLQAEDVGIISPYRKQVEKIRLLMSAFKLYTCKVGSVEEFQGQERRVIIISTVRSDDILADFDATHNLGFVSNRKRLNVAVTRAKQLLIVIGNPNVLCTDYYWNAFIQYCISNGGYTGCEFPSSLKKGDSCC